MTLAANDLAREFSCKLRDYLTPEHMAEVIARNANERDKNICHSHDFADANQIMLDALEALGVPYDEAEDNGTINEAWDLAKAAGFDPEKI